MTRIAHSLLAGIAALGFASGAHAADLYSNYSSSPGIMNMGGSGGWDGAYIGGFVGYGWGTVTDTNGDIVPNLPGDELDAAGWLIGAALGANFTVTEGFVAGAVGDIAWTGINGYDAPSDLDYSVNWEASLRGRAGFDGGAFMPYLTAGLAVAGATGDIGGADSSHVHFGWTAGAGVEVAVTDQISVDLLYRYSDYGTAEYGNLPNDPSLKLTTHAVTAGANFKF